MNEELKNTEGLLKNYLFKYFSQDSNPSSKIFNISKSFPSSQSTARTAQTFLHQNPIDSPTPNIPQNQSAEHLFPATSDTTTRKTFDFLIFEFKHLLFFLLYFEARKPREPKRRKKSFKCVSLFVVLFILFPYQLTRVYVNFLKKPNEMSFAENQMRESAGQIDFS